MNVDLKTALEEAELARLETVTSMGDLQASFSDQLTFLPVEAAARGHHQLHDLFCYFICSHCAAVVVALWGRITIEPILFYI